MSTKKRPIFGLNIFYYQCLMYWISKPYHVFFGYHSLGMKKIAVSYGAHHISRLQAYDPDLCVHEFEQILQW